MKHKSLSMLILKGSKSHNGGVSYLLNDKLNLKKDIPFKISKHILPNLSILG